MVYQVIALILISTFYLSYCIKNKLLKKKSIEVNQLGKNESKGIKLYRFEKKLKFFTYLMVIIQYASIIIDDEWYYVNVPDCIKIIGLVLLCISNIIFLLSIYCMKDNWRVGINFTNESNNKTELVKTGIYKISRNPAFLGFDLLYIGLLFVFSNPVNLIMTIILVWMFDEQIKYEEQYLLFQFKDEYEEYMKKTKRYFLFF